MMSTGFAMVGPRAGDQVAVLGAPTKDEASLAAEIAKTTGLNGRTLVVDVGPEARKRVESAAAKAGSLVEFEWAPVTMLPLGDEQFDVTVINRQLNSLQGLNRQACCQEALRVTKTRGRVLVIEPMGRPGLFGLLPGATPGLSPAEIVASLTAVGAAAIRVLAETDGAVYVEGRKPA